MRILVVEDYGPIRGAVVTALRDEGWNVELAADGTSAAEILDEPGTWDLVVLDLMIPGIDGLSLLKKMRREGDSVHVMVVTARDAVESRVEALDAGADDYLVKPFAMEELIARARALFRRKHTKKSPVVTVGPLVVDTAGRSVTVAENAVELTAREYALLEYMMYREGEVVPREDLHTNLYGDASASSNVVDVYVGYLRKKLEADGTPRLLHTKRGVGYVMEFRGGSDDATSDEAVND